MEPITLKTLHNATEQQVFDQVATHLLKQMKQSRADFRDRGAGVMCAYRGEGGLKCAAGCLIGDDEYDDRIEAHGWSYLTEEGLVLEAHEDLIESLQGLHDGSDPARWKEGLIAIAESFSLSVERLEMMEGAGQESAQ